MKGEHVLAQIIAVLGMVLYLVLVQHVYAEMFEHPERSWLNQLRAWWVTRGSREREIKLRKVWDQPLAAEEP